MNFFPEDKVFHIDGTRYEASMTEFLNLPAEERNRFQLVKGHQFFGVHRHLAGHPKYFTILRDPLDRLVSLYNYCRIAPEITFRNEILDKKLDFYEFVKSGLSRTADNGMVRFVSGIGWDQVPYGHCTDEMLQMAIGNIREHFVLAGLTEEFEDTFLLLKTILKLKGFPFVTASRNISAERNVDGIPLMKRKDLDTDKLAGILPFYKFDQALFDYAQSEFKQIKSRYARPLAWNKLRFSWARAWQGKQST